MLEAFTSANEFAPVIALAVIVTFFMMFVSRARRVSALQRENRRLKSMLDMMLDQSYAKDAR